MPKPSDDVPRDVWLVGQAVLRELRHRDGYLSPSDYINAGILAERERCAKIAWMLGATSTDPFVGNAGHVVADAIRKGGQ